MLSTPLLFEAVFRIRIRVRIWCWYSWPYGSGFGIRIRFQEDKIDHRKEKKLTNFMFWRKGYLRRAGVFSNSWEVLQWGLWITSFLRFSYQKIIIVSVRKIQYLSIKILHVDPDSLNSLGPDRDSDSVHMEYGSATQLLAPMGWWKISDWLVPKSRDENHKE